MGCLHSGESGMLGGVLWPDWCIFPLLEHQASFCSGAVSGFPFLPRSVCKLLLFIQQIFMECFSTLGTVLGAEGTSEDSCHPAWSRCVDTPVTRLSLLEVTTASSHLVLGLCLLKEQIWLRSLSSPLFSLCLCSISLRSKTRK